MRVLALLVVLFSCVPSAPQPQAPQAPQAPEGYDNYTAYLHHKNAVVVERICPTRQASGTGSGVLIRENIVLTAEHVLSPCDLSLGYVNVVKHDPLDPRNYETLRAKIVFTDADHDWALLEIPKSLTDTPAQVAEMGPGLGAEVRQVTGFPLTRATSEVILVHSEDNIIMLRGVGGDTMVRPGDSGGPVYYRGKVVAIITRYTNPIQGRVIGIANLVTQSMIAEALDQETRLH